MQESALHRRGAIQNPKSKIQNVKARNESQNTVTLYYSLAHEKT